MAHDPAALAKGLHGLLSQGRGLPHYLLAGSIFAVLLVCFWRVCALVEPFILRTVHRGLFGEWQWNEVTRSMHRIIGRDQFGALTDPTSHEERRLAAITGRDGRRWGIAFCVVTLAFAWWFAVTADFHHADFGLVLLTVLLAIIALTAAALLPVLLIQEWGYRIGYVHMEGARVVDPPPAPPPGPEVVGQQGIYGTDKAAPPGDIGTTYGGNRTAESDRIWKD